MERRAQQVATLREQGIQVVTPVFYAAVVTADAETHFRRLSLDSELIQKLDKHGVSPVIVNNETCVDRVLAAMMLDIDGCGMPPDSRRRFIDGYVVSVPQVVGGGQAGYTGTDDCDIHSHAPLFDSVVDCSVFGATIFCQVRGISFDSHSVADSRRGKL